DKLKRRTIRGIILKTDDSPHITGTLNLNTIDSKIITNQHAELISKWINKLKICNKFKNSYKFNLLFRASRDGFCSSKFHETCDNQSRTVTIVKVKDSNEILGGYNPIEWKSDRSWGITK